MDLLWRGNRETYFHSVKYVKAKISFPAVPKIRVFHANSVFLHFFGFIKKEIFDSSVSLRPPRLDPLKKDRSRGRMKIQWKNFLCVPRNIYVIPQNKYYIHASPLLSLHLLIDRYWTPATPEVKQMALQLNPTSCINYLAMWIVITSPYVEVSYNFQQKSIPTCSEYVAIIWYYFSYKDNNTHKDIARTVEDTYITSEKCH